MSAEEHVKKLQAEVSKLRTENRRLAQVAEARRKHLAADIPLAKKPSKLGKIVAKK